MKGPRSGFRSALRESPEMVGGRYRLGAVIGRGGAADVHEAFDVRLGREVAVKLFRPDTDPRMEERFSEEAVLLARMQHPGLVTVYDAGRHAGRSYLVMQLIKGETLRTRLAAGPLPPGRVAGLGATLAQALAHVHGAGIVHRDVKPSNVLLDTWGSPHLTDFGIARLVNATRHTAPDVLIGTAAYLAPEQALGQEVAPATDVYALGLVLLECLKGELEYDGTPLESAVARLHRQPVVPPSVPPRLACLLHAMTARDDKARPDAEHCAQELSALCADTRVSARTGGTAVAEAKELPVEPTAAHPRTGTGLAGKTKHTRRRTAGAVLTALSATLTATLVVAPGSSDTNAGRPDSGPPTSPSAESPTRNAIGEAPSTTVPRPAASTLPSDSRTARSPVSDGSDGGSGAYDRTPSGTALRDAREPKQKAKKTADSGAAAESGTPAGSGTATDPGTPTDSGTATDPGTPTDSTAGAAETGKPKKSQVFKGREDHG